MNSLTANKRAAAAAIIASMDSNPRQWTYEYKGSRGTIKHPTGVALRFICGEAEVTRPHRMEFGWLDWFPLRRAYKRWTRRQGKAQADASDIATCQQIVEALS